MASHECRDCFEIRMKPIPQETDVLNAKIIPSQQIARLGGAFIYLITIEYERNRDFVGMFFSIAHK